jgi:hypothetical protein
LEQVEQVVQLQDKVLQELIQYFQQSHQLEVVVEDFSQDHLEDQMV